MTLRAPEDGGNEHAAHHAMWVIGVQAPRNLEWWSDLAVVTTESPIAWRRLAHRVGRMPQRENHYDVNSWTHLGEPEQTPDNVRAYLLQANGYVIGYLATHDVSEHRRWDLLDESEYGDQDDTLRPCIDLIWVADSYRERALARRSYRPSPMTPGARPPMCRGQPPSAPPAGASHAGSRPTASGSADLAGDIPATGPGGSDNSASATTPRGLR